MITPSDFRLQTTRPRGFTLLEMLLVVLLIPAVLAIMAVVGAFVPMLILQAFGYVISFWSVLYVHLLAIAMGIGFSLLGKSSNDGREGRGTKRGLFHLLLGYSLNAVLQMLIYGSLGYDIGFLHILIAELPLIVLYRITLIVIERRRKQKSDKIEGTGLILPGDEKNK